MLLSRLCMRMFRDSKSVFTIGAVCGLALAGHTGVAWGQNEIGVSISSDVAVVGSNVYDEEGIQEARLATSDAAQGHVLLDRTVYRPRVVEIQHGTESLAAANRWCHNADRNGPAQSANEDYVEVDSARPQEVVIRHFPFDQRLAPPPRFPSTSVTRPRPETQVAVVCT